MGTVIRPEVSAKIKYWLSKHRYYELKHFCLQYPEWKRVYHDLDGLPARSASVTGFTRGGQTPNPTALYAEARIYYIVAFALSSIHAGMLIWKNLSKRLLSTVERSKVWKKAFLQEDAWSRRGL